MIFALIAIVTSAVTGMGGPLILEYQKSSAPTGPASLNALGVQTVLNKTLLEARMLVLKNIANHPPVSAV
jgi:hypothetical protein